MILAFVASLTAQSLIAQPTETKDAEIVVVGSRESSKLNTKALRAARSEFLAHRQRYAPESSLSFVIDKKAGGSFPARQIKLYFTDGTNRVEVETFADSTFMIDALPMSDWLVESNLPRRDVRIEPRILSPRSTRLDYRLGDGRLQCRVMWAMIKASASLLAAPLMRAVQAAGPCTNKKISLYANAPGIIRTAALVEGEQSVPLELGNNRLSYRLPMTEQTFSNEARIRIIPE